MKKINSNVNLGLIIGGVLLLLVILFSFGGKQGGSMVLSSSDFMAKYKSTPNAVLLDVRTPSEYNAGHIPSAINVDFENANFTSEVKTLDPSKTYFVYCRSGNRSSQAIPIMKGDNINNIYELQGGISSAPNLLQ